MEVTCAAGSNPRSENKRSAGAWSVAVAFENLQVDPSGLATAGVITLVAPLSDLEISGGPLTDHAGTCGTDLTLESRAKISKTAPGEVKVTGPMTAELPYRDAKGKRAAFANFRTNGNGGVTLLKDPKDTSDTLFELHDTGQLRFHLSGGQAVPGHTDNFDLSGFNFKPDTLNLDLTRIGTTGNDSFTARSRSSAKATPGLLVDMPSALVQAPLANLLTQDEKPLALKVSDVTVASGLPTFNIDKGIVFTSSIADTEGKQKRLPDPEIALIKPLDFALCVHSASIHIKEGALTIFTLDEVKLVLPEILDQYAKDKQTNFHIKSPGFRLDLPAINLLDLQTPLLLEPKSPVLLNFAEDHSLTSTKMLLDLSSEGPVNADTVEPGVGGPAWMGLFFSRAEADTVEANNAFFADGFGVTGVVTAKDKAIKSYDGKNYYLTGVKGGEAFRRNQTLHGGGYEGRLEPATRAVPPQSPGPALSYSIPVKGAFSSNGQTVVVQPCEVTIPKNKIHLNIAAGTLEKEGNTSTLLLAGSLDFPGATQLADPSTPAIFPFLDLRLNSSGVLDPPDHVVHFSHPTEAKFGSTKVVATALSNDPALGKIPRILGGLDLADNLPVATSEQFLGIPITDKGEIDVATFASEKFHLDVPLAGIGRIVGDIAYVENDTKSNPSTYMGGDVSFELGGDDNDKGAGENLTPTTPSPAHGDGPTANLEFRVADGAWFARGFVNTKPFGIALPIASTGLYLRGFKGAIGHNVDHAAPDAISGQVDFNTVTLNKAKGNWFCSAGVRVASGSGLDGSGDDSSVWLDVNLTLDTNPVLIALEGDVYLQDPYLELPNLSPKNGLGYGHVAVMYNGADKSFRAAADAHLSLKAGGKPVVTADGSMELLVAPNNKHFYIGWPFPDKAVNVSAFGISMAGGVGMDIKPAVMFGAGFKESFSEGPLSGEIDGMLTTTLFPALSVAATLHASGEVDFYVFSLGAEAFLSADVSSDHVTFDGDFTGYIDTWVGDISASVPFEVTLPP